MLCLVLLLYVVVCIDQLSMWIWYKISGLVKTVVSFHCIVMKNISLYCQLHCVSKSLHFLFTQLSGQMLTDLVVL